MSIEVYQSGILGPSQVVDYSGTVMQAYGPDVVLREPFVGFKVLCRDRGGMSMNPRFRLEQLDRGLVQILPGTGCIVREASTLEIPDKSGLWVITMPVPRSQVAEQMKYLMTVLAILERDAGIVLAGTYEVNVSGRCTPQETEHALGSLYITPDYAQYSVNPPNSPYKLGQVIRINDYFMCYRTRWNFSNKPVADVYKDLIVLSQLISAIYH